ncbi:MAG: AMP-binding protein, partial [Ilumatobacteraceae bacterium]
MDDRANRFIAVLGELDIGRGQTIALLARNETEFFELQLGCQRAGVTLATLNFWLAVAELDQVIDRISPRLLIHGPGLAESAAALDVQPTLYLGADGAGASYEKCIQRADPVRGRPAIDPDAVATLLFTSGTSGQAKGVPMTNRVILARQAQAAMEVPIQPGAVFFQPQPMFHMSSQVSYACALMGATTVLNQGFETDTVADA